MKRNAILGFLVIVIGLPGIVPQALAQDDFRESPWPRSPKTVQKGPLWEIALEELPGLPSFTQMQGSRFGGCGVVEPRTLVCWNDEIERVTRTLPHDVDILEVTRGQTCAASHAGEVSCWTEDGAMYTVGPFQGVRSMGLGVSPCVVDNTGTTHCWYPVYDPETEQYPMETVALTGLPIARSLHATLHNDLCILSEDGRLLCTQMYDTELPPEASTFQALTNNTVQVVDVAAGEFGVCWLYRDGTVMCRGENQQHIPVTGMPVLVEITGRYNFCGLDAQNGVWCWARSNDPHVAYPVELPIEVRDMSVLDEHVCALDAQGDTWCWGEDMIHEIGNFYGGGQERDYNTPHEDLSPEGKPSFSLLAGGGSTVAPSDTAFGELSLRLDYLWYFDEEAFGVGAFVNLHSDFARGVGLEGGLNFAITPAVVISGGIGGRVPLVTDVSPLYATAELHIRPWAYTTQGFLYFVGVYVDSTFDIDGTPAYTVSGGLELDLVGLFVLAFL